MPKRSVDPLGRNHQIERKPKNRWQIDRVCDHVMLTTYESFKDNPSSLSIYYDAYCVVFGNDEAFKMLQRTREQNESR
jgi:hypothetical protein